jgi:hypothetical protein
MAPGWDDAVQGWDRDAGQNAWQRWSLRERTLFYYIKIVLETHYPPALQGWQICAIRYLVLRSMIFLFAEYFEFDIPSAAVEKWGWAELRAKHPERSGAECALSAITDVPKSPRQSTSPQF